MNTRCLCCGNVLTGADVVKHSYPICVGCFERGATYAASSSAKRARKLALEKVWREFDHHIAIQIGVDGSQDPHEHVKVLKQAKRNIQLALKQWRK